ncbi:hypothetical protein [Proteiniborus sp.]|uniref:hypothetical protein n=1 Tax=Proteiniborus sp. TaxID=2079015 RepID=UPI00331E9A8E
MRRIINNDQEHKYENVHEIEFVESIEEKVSNKDNDYFTNWFFMIVVIIFLFLIIGF